MRFWRRIKALASVLQGHSITATSTLGMRVIRGDGRVEDLGIVCRKKVTVSFVNDIVDALQGTGPYTTFNAYKYHDYGTGVTAEANTQTGLIIPCGEAREVGTQVEGASANIYKSVATHTFAGTFAITEHGLFNAASGVTLMDRSLFAAINVVSGDKIESTYQLTINAEA